MSETVDDHKDLFFRQLNKLRLQNVLCDVCLNVNDKTFSCHRIVLATVSPYFKTMFNGNFKESKCDVVTIHDVESETFEEILNAIYTASIRLLPCNVYCILKASHKMQLQSIKNVCISYIINNTKIGYLVDTCLLALSIEETKLHSKCVHAISNDLLTYGQSECFEKISLDLFKSILSKNKFGEDEEEGIFLLIAQWCKDNNASCDDVRALLESARLKITNNIRPLIMADLIVNSISNCSSLNEKCIKITKESETDSRFGLNLYFNGIDVKSCEKGWGILKINDEFDGYILSSFHPAEITDTLYRKVIKAKSKMFCLESTTDKSIFSYYNEDESKVFLKTPPFHFKSYDMVKIGGTLYVMKKDCDNNCIWAYDCERNTWETKFLSFSPPNNNEGSSIFGNGSFGRVTPSFSPPLKFSSLMSMDGILYLIANKGDSNKYITSFDIRSPNAQVLGLIAFEQDKHVNAAVCAFDKKIALSGSNHQGILNSSFSIFDITAKRWLYDVKPMNIARANHNLIHRNGFIYAVENTRRFVFNEKYDLKWNKWITLPSLPRRVASECADDIITVSTGDMFGIETEY